MLKLPLLAAVVMVLAFLQGGVSFKTIDRGGQSGIEEPRQVVVRTAAEWEKLWKEHALDRPLPPVDFTKAIVVGVFLGYRPTGGYGVEITGIERKDGEAVVTYRERKPQKTDIVTQVITMPYHLVSLDKIAGEVRFTRAP